MTCVQCILSPFVFHCINYVYENAICTCKTLLLLYKPHIFSCPTISGCKPILALPMLKKNITNVFMSSSFNLISLHLFWDLSVAICNLSFSTSDAPQTYSAYDFPIFFSFMRGKRLLYINVKVSTYMYCSTNRHEVCYVH